MSFKLPHFDKTADIYQTKDDEQNKSVRNVQNKRH